MNGSQQTEKKKKKSYVGVIGFGLALGSHFLGPFLILLIIPAFILCLIGIFRKSHRILSSIGLTICLFWLSILFIFMFAMTPPGSIPYPLSIVKFRMNAPSFWVRFDRARLTKAQSQYWLFGGAGGALYFKSDESGTFKKKEVIKFAEKNGWRFENETNLNKEEFSKFLDEKGQILGLDIDAYFSPFDNKDDYEQSRKIHEKDMKKTDILREMTMGLGPWCFTLWIQQDCTILSFDTDNICFSHIVINHNGTEMAVYYNGVR
jgi:hypothetical protein